MTRSAVTMPLAIRVLMIFSFILVHAALLARSIALPRKLKRQVQDLARSSGGCVCMCEALNIEGFT